MNKIFPQTNKHITEPFLCASEDLHSIFSEKGIRVVGPKFWPNGKREEQKCEEPKLNCDANMCLLLVLDINTKPYVAIQLHIILTDLW